MRLRPTNGVLDGGEGQKCPPLPFLEVEDAEAQSLIDRGLAVEYVEEAAGPAAETGEQKSPPKTKGGKGSVGATGEGAASGSKTPAAPEADPHAATRMRDIADHIALLSADERDENGKPKLDALKAALGFEVTPEEVEAALALEA